MKLVNFWFNLRKRWRAIVKQARYETDKKMVGYHLERSYNYVRAVFLGPGTNEIPVLAPVKSAEQWVTGVRESFRRTPGLHLHDESYLVEIEDAVAVMFIETNFVDVCMDFRDNQLAVRLLNRPRIQGLPLPAVPRWTDDDWRETDGPRDGRRDIGAEL